MNKTAICLAILGTALFAAGCQSEPARIANISLEGHPANPDSPSAEPIRFGSALDPELKNPAVKLQAPKHRDHSAPRTDGGSHEHHHH